MGRAPGGKGEGLGFEGVQQALGFVEANFAVGEQAEDALAGLPQLFLGVGSLGAGGFGLGLRWWGRWRGWGFFRLG